jgi:hypothetical protein
VRKRLRTSRVLRGGASCVPNTSCLHSFSRPVTRARACTPANTRTRPHLTQVQAAAALAAARAAAEEHAPSPTTSCDLCLQLAIALHTSAAAGIMAEIEQQREPRRQPQQQTEQGGVQAAAAAPPGGGGLATRAEVRQKQPSVRGWCHARVPLAGCTPPAADAT